MNVPYLPNNGIDIMQSQHQYTVAKKKEHAKSQEDAPKYPATALRKFTHI